MTPRPATDPAKTTTKPQTQSTTPTKRKPPVSQKAVENGAYIRKAREKARITEQELADELGVSQNKINKIENGQVKLTVEDAEKIAEILGKKASEIIPSLASQYDLKQSNNKYENSNGVAFTVNPQDFEPERKVWQELDKARQGEILAKNETITAQNALIAAKERLLAELCQA